MKRVVKVAVTGTHSTRKTIFLTALSRALTELSYTVAKVADLGKEAAERGFPILDHHTAHSTLWIMARGISLELEAAHRADVVLVDRPAPDALGYYHAALIYRDERPSPVWRDYLTRLARDHAATYDVIFKTELDLTIPLGDDKPRDTDLRFRTLADQAVTTVLTDLVIPHYRIPPADHALAVRFVLDYVRDRITGTGTGTLDAALVRVRECGFGSRRFRAPRLSRLPSGPRCPGCPRRLRCYSYAQSSSSRSFVLLMDLSCVAEFDKRLCTIALDR